MSKDYSIGLDIGTNSIGWAVVKDDYTVVKKRMRVQGNTDRQYIKKNFLGSLLFESGESAKDRRLKRTQRRRYERRKYRIRELQKIFSPAIAEVDENFFHRLNESFLVPGDKQYSPHYIFGNYAMERAYHEEFPTIYHLRKKLSDVDEPCDIRLVYLALAHIIKYRGHFLIDGELNTRDLYIADNFKSFLETYNQLQADSSNCIEFDELSLSSVESVLKEKMSRTKKYQALKKIFPAATKDKFFDLLLKLIVGNQANFTKILDSDEDIKMKLSDDDYDETLEIVLGILGDDYIDLFVDIKKIYNAMELSGILDDEDDDSNAKLSSKMVKLYDEHKKQLETYRKLVRENPALSYRETFHDISKNGYAGYIHGKTNQENFYKFVKKQLKDVDGAEKILKWIENEQFLRKQRSFYNGVIPHQVHAAELDAILENQGQYYPFLRENKDKIKLLLNFRIPYYVGPLSRGQSEFAWIQRLSDEPIQPWNFEESIDLDASAEEFINRLTGYDTYLPDEKVLPKKSLLYQKFTIFNELTKVTYQDERGEQLHFSSREKQDIFNALFKKRARVTEAQLKKFVENNYGIDSTIICGIEDAFNANYSTYLEFSKIKGLKELLDDPRHEDTLESIVKILTVFEDPKMRRHQLEQFSEFLPPEAIRDLSKKHFTGWGKLSAKLIDGIYDAQSQKSILDFLINDDGCPKNTNRNFMQLINDETLSFKSIIEKAQVVDTSKDLKDIVSELPGSPAIKKGIYLSLQIVDEIIRIMGYKPKNIVIEMAREHQTTSQGKQRAKARLAIVEAGLKEFGSNLLKEHPITADDLKDRKLYLYYLQNGKDMYTGEALDIDHLAYYDIDHIIPQSFLYDNSTDNVVLTKRTANLRKSNDVPDAEIAQRQLAFWRRLKDCGLLSERKFNNLTKSLRGGLTAKDKERFINRQLVETRQITKNVANILDAHLNPDKENRTTDIILIKSSIANSFRKMFQLYKIRDLNDYHHAHDAYLNTVIALKLLEEYPYSAKDFVYGEYRYTYKPKKNRATHKKKKLDQLIKQMQQDWSEGDDLATVKKVLNYRQVNIVKKVETNTGALFKETIYGRGEKKDPVPIKRHLDPQKYGGYDSIVPGFYIALNYRKNNGKKARSIIGIPLKDISFYEADQTAYLESKGYPDAIIIQELKNYTLFEFPDGTKRFISGSQELQKANQLVLPEHLTTFLYHLMHYNSISFPESYEYVLQHQHLFDELFTEIILFADKYLDADDRVEKIKNSYEKTKQTDINSEKTRQTNIDNLATSFTNLLKFVKSGAPTDFDFLDTKIPRKRYSSLGSLWNAEIIFQSLTGLYETRQTLEESHGL